MKILMIHPHDLFSSQEPWTIRIKKFAAVFKRNGHDIRMVYYPLDSSRVRYPFKRDGIEYFPWSRKVGLRPLLNNLKQARQLGAWADMVHLQKCFYHAALPALCAAYLNNKPLHYDWDDWEIKIFNHSAKQPLLIRFYLGMLERVLPLLAESVSVSSRRLAEECRKYGVPEGRIFPAPVGADLEMFNPGVSGLRVRERYNITGEMAIYIGQLHGGQYAEQFIRAAKMVLNRRQGTRFVVVGDGYQRQELEKFSQRLGLEGQMLFTGPVPHEEMPQYVAAADVAVACFEANDITECKSPLKIAEYLAAGKAIAASDVGEVKRMLGGAGVLAVPGDAGSLAETIIRLFEDEPLRKRLQLKARQRAEEIFNWENTAINVLKAYSGEKQGTRG